MVRQIKAILYPIHIFFLFTASFLHRWHLNNQKQTSKGILNQMEKTMKTMKNAFLMVIAALMVISLQAQPGPGNGPRDGSGSGNGPQGPKEGKWMQSLKLTEDQQQQIGQLRTAQQSEAQEIRAQLKIKEAELDAAMIKEDGKKANALVSEINTLQGKLMSQRVNHQLAVKALLTDDQKVIFDQHILEKGKANGDRPPRPEGKGQGGNGPGPKGRGNN